MSDEGLTVFGVSFQRVELSDRMRQILEDFRSDHEGKFAVLDEDKVFECPFLRDAAIVALYDRASIPYVPGYYIVDESGVTYLYEAIAGIVENGSEHFVLSAHSAPRYAAFVPYGLILNSPHDVQEPHSLADLNASGVIAERLLSVTPSSEGFSIQAFVVAENDRVLRMTFSVKHAERGRIADAIFGETGSTCLPVEAML